MNKFIYLLLTFVLASVFSCSKTPANGALDGQWQLMEINTKANAYDPGYSQSLSKKKDRVYWCFQLDLMMVQETRLTPWIYAKFIHEKGYLHLTSIYKNNRPLDSLYTDPNTTLFEPIGISGNAESYKVEKLNHKKMILTTKVKQLVFKKLG